MNAPHAGLTTLDLENFWMPFTANRQFKSAPRLLAAAKDMHYTTVDGHEVLDGTAGLWCVQAGHCRDKITSAIQKQAATMDFGPTFQMGHPGAFEAARKIADMAPPGLDYVFFANSGSEAVDSALKIALAYHRARGEGHRTVFIGRERGYHGVGFGGISVGGMTGNRKTFGSMLPRVDHLPHTFNLEKQAFSRGQPEWGAHLADDLEQRIIPLHDASNIAAVIVEPMAGSTGVLIPPKGYLQRLREICDKYNLLLIFDEVITGFGRVGPHAFAADVFGVVPDMITCAKGVTNASVPMGAVIAKRSIYETFMNAPPNAIEFSHGYTYSGHPLASAAASATLDLYREEQLFERAAALSEYFQDAAHGLRGLPHVIDVRSIGLVAGIELQPMADKPTVRAFEAFLRCFDKNVLIRTTGETIALSPPLIAEKKHIDQLFGTIADVLKTLP
ncbi:MAG: aspartate aminotransferase family protein [Burkholderiales bacterium]